MIISFLLRLWRWLLSFFVQPQLPPPPEPPGDEADFFLLPYAPVPMILEQPKEEPPKAAARTIIRIGSTSTFRTGEDVRL